MGACERSRTGEGHRGVCLGRGSGHKLDGRKEEEVEQARAPRPFSHEAKVWLQAHVCLAPVAM